MRRLDVVRECFLAQDSREDASFVCGLLLRLAKSGRFNLTVRPGFTRGSSMGKCAGHTTCSEARRGSIIIVPDLTILQLLLFLASQVRLLGSKHKRCLRDIADHARGKEEEAAEEVLKIYGVKQAA